MVYKPALIWCAIGLTIAGCAADAPRSEAQSCVTVVASKAKYVPGGLTKLGSDRFHAEEGPVRWTQVPGFWIDTHEVTNAQFAEFVIQTGYKTTAERSREPVTMVFDPEGGELWRARAGASWRSPRGGGSTINGRNAFPVVQVTLEDAQAYAQWAGGKLPTEAQWERAARGGLADAEYSWGDSRKPDGKFRANTHQGAFPVQDSGSDGFAGAAPVSCFQANGYGLFDMAGNVWEWTGDNWSEAGIADVEARVVKGGSFLCSDSICERYRPAARQAGLVGYATEHTGIRIVYVQKPPPG